MIEVHPRLYVGHDQDWELAVKGLPTWATVHCAKEPYHRDAVGYSEPGAPKDHFEYLVARRGRELCLNMVDSKDPAYIPLEMVKAAVHWIFAEHRLGRQVLVHCNRGESRGPTVALLFLARELDRNFPKSEEKFMKVYPPYRPGTGCRQFAMQNWDYFRGLR